MPLALEDLTADTFAPHRDEIFRATAGGIAVNLRLIDIHGLSRGARTGGAFALTFVGAPGPYLPQAIYPLTHETLGTLEIFLVPIGPVEGGNGYEAVFN